MHGDVQYVKSKNKPIKVKVAKVCDREIPKMAVFLFGANHTLTNLHMFPPSTLLLPEDFKSSITFDVSYKNMPSGNFPKKFKFKHLLPNVFRQIRYKFNINEKNFIQSFKQEPTPINCKHMNCYESANHMFIFKVIDSEYVEGLINLMPSYYRYLSEKKFNTFLPQYFAIFKITIENKKTCIVVMKNIMAGSFKDYNFFKINYSYEKDLSKDSEPSDEKRRKKNVDSIDQNNTNNTTSTTTNEFSFDISSKTRAAIIEKASNDAKFLCENNVFGWSFLVCRSKSNHNGKHLSCPSSPITIKNKRFSYNAATLLNDINSVTDDGVLLDENKINLNITTINNYFINSKDISVNNYFGCLDISSHCKHVKKTFTDKSKKKQPASQPKSGGDTETNTTTNNHQKNKGKFVDPNKFLQIFTNIFPSTTEHDSLFIDKNADDINNAIFSSDSQLS